jgi:hypothetical protein
MTDNKPVTTPSIIRGGYIVLSAEGMRTRQIPVSSADEPSATWRRFVEDNDLGASDLKRDSGFIYSNDRKLVAKVSYNGRVWTPDGQLLQEHPNPLPSFHSSRNPRKRGRSVNRTLLNP